MGNIGSPTLGGLANSTGSVTPPPPLGLFGMTRGAAAPPDRAFTLGGGIFPPRTPTVGQSQQQRNPNVIFGKSVHYALHILCMRVY